MKLNVGSAQDIKDGWTNIDIKPIDGAIQHDARQPFTTPPADFILINHVLCTMDYDDVLDVLKNVHEALEDGGKVQIIDMDLLKSFELYQNDPNKLPIARGSKDYKLCMHISGYSTRLSLYTPRLMQELLYLAGFSASYVLDNSEYDTRPDESLIVEAIK